MARKYIFLIFAIILLQGISFSFSSSSYNITSHLVDSGGAASVSTSYKIIGKTRSTQIVNPASSNNIIGEGFLKTAYFYIAPAVLAPLVTSLDPAAGVNSGTVEITSLLGANFASGATVKLSRTGQSDIVATSVSVISAGKISCILDLTNAVAGLWDVTVTNSDGRSGSLPSAFKITYAVPTVTSITPASGFNNETVSISNLVGTYFRNGASVYLRKSGELDISAGGVVVVNSSKITCSVNLSGKSVGMWDVVVVNDDSGSGTLSGAFKIEAPELQVIGQVRNTPNPFNPGTGSTKINYVLSKDAEIKIMIFNMRGQFISQIICPVGSEGGKVGQNSVAWTGYLQEFGSVASSGVYIYHILGKTNGETKLLGKGKIAVIK